ncbi:MAG: glutathione S-transferase family protein [Myxococcales bacterium]
MQLYYFETMNPRKACFVAKHLSLPIDYVRVDFTKGEQRRPEYLALNPNGRAPTLVDGERTLWESVAIMAHLARKAESELWPLHDADSLTEVLRWISWDAFHFAPHAGTFYFELYIKPLLGLGNPSRDKLEEREPLLRRSARVLDGHLEGRKYLVGERLSLADVCVAVLLPMAEEIQLPLVEFGNIRRWHAGLMELPAWRNPWPVSAPTA